MKNVLAINNQFPTEDHWKYGLVSAVTYYRQVMPGKHLSGFRFNHLGHRLINLDPQSAEKVIGDMVKDHDIVFSKHIDNPQGIYMLLGACDFYNKPLIVDFDDDVFATDGMEHNRYVYKDGSDYKHYAETFVRNATAVTVSTKPLMDVYGQYNANVFLCPNAVDLDDWKLERKKHKRLTVGWPASTSHIVDHPAFDPIIKEVAKRYPHIVFSVMGHYTPEMLKFLPRDSWEVKPGLLWWSGHPKDARTYPQVLAEFGADIGVAPLIKSRYNAARSLVKWFEYTLTGTPTIATAYGPYTELTHDHDICLVKSSQEWIDALVRLIENPQERERLTKNAENTIKSRYTIQDTIGSWRDVFESQKRFQKHYSP